MSSYTRPIRRQVCGYQLLNHLNQKSPVHLTPTYLYSCAYAITHVSTRSVIKLTHHNQGYVRAAQNKYKELFNESFNEQNYFTARTLFTTKRLR